MRGIDKIDALVGFYRTFFKSKKWYRQILFNFMDIALVNAWLLYRRDMLNVAPGEPYLRLCVQTKGLRITTKPTYV